MDAQRIIQDLQRRFDRTTWPVFYDRRIVFWYDEAREFEELVDTLSLDNAKIVKLTGSNFFAVKKLLALDDTESNYLVYCPLAFEHREDNWLLNMELYSDVFRADLYSMWMEEMGLSALDVPSRDALRGVVKRYHKFFQSAERRKKIQAMSAGITSPAKMHLAVMAVICGEKTPGRNILLRAVLKGGLNAEDNAIYKDMERYEAKDAFWALAAQVSGCSSGDSSLAGLAAQLLITAMSRTMPSVMGSDACGLDRYISEPHQDRCYELVSEWLHSSDDQSLYDIARIVEEDHGLFDCFSRLEEDDLLDAECFPCINEVILTKLMTAVSEQRSQADHIRKTAGKRRTMAWYDKVADYYEGLCQVAAMQTFKRDHAQGFHLATPQDIWRAYTADYYRMDMSYRQFRLHFNRSLRSPVPCLDDLFKNVASDVEKLYSNWYLAGLADNWSSVAEEDLGQYGYIPDVERQTAFYGNYVRHSDTRVFVIISDALRYEVAASLAEQLKELQGRTELGSMCGIFPTETRFGMAALLPHGELGVRAQAGGDLSVLADGQSTSGMENREKVLLAASQSGIVLEYGSFLNMKQTERRELIKGRNVVYIYHNRIDKAAHVSDSSVFQACQEAIEDIKSLVSLIANSLGGTRILVTADHGFLFTGTPLTEDGKVSRENWNGCEAEYSSRYAIMKKGAMPDCLMPVRFLDGRTDYDAFAPRENVRIKVKGLSSQFVHGGISLQEMVVPLVKFHYLRSATREYQKNRAKIDTKPVELGLLSESRKITNKIVMLDFYQKEAVGGNREKAAYAIWFADSSGRPVSNTVRIIADKTDEQDMSFRCTFNLKSQQYDRTAPYYLLISREGVLDNPARYEFRIDIALAVDEFNFF